jgi:hypothetical protein
VSKEVRDALVVFCKSQNPNFNEFRWLEYLVGKCGPNGGTVEIRTTKGRRPKPFSNATLYSRN